MSEARARRGPAYDAAVEAGRSLRLEYVIEEAFDFLEQVSANAQMPPTGTAHSHGLTPREQEILRLVATGLSDREIAAALFISRHTAMRHVANSLTKLGVGSRTAAAALAVRDGLA